jgi:hypothetical protein
MTNQYQDMAYDGNFPHIKWLFLTIMAIILLNIDEF